MEKYIKPEFRKDAFNCPHCGVYAKMRWYDFGFRVEGYAFFHAQCWYCSRQTIWYDKDKESGMFFPKDTAIPPQEDMPEKVKKIYEEASLVLGDSPRASCALLRLALQELMKYLKENVDRYRELKDENLSQCIKQMLEIGTFDQDQKEILQESMDSIRLVGNKVIHPSELDINDNPEIANILFAMLNSIVKEVITRPKKIKEDVRILQEAINKTQNSNS